MRSSMRSSARRGMSISSTSGKGFPRNWERSPSSWSSRRNWLRSCSSSSSCSRRRRRRSPSSRSSIGSSIWSSSPRRRRSISGKRSRSSNSKGRGLVVVAVLAVEVGVVGLISGSTSRRSSKRGLETRAVGAAVVVVVPVATSVRHGLFAHHVPSLAESCCFLPPLSPPLP